MSPQLGHMKRTLKVPPSRTVTCVDGLLLELLRNGC
jgi:hypothetical protein